MQASDIQVPQERFPRVWTDICGHAEIIRRLRRLCLLGRVPHALLFTGPDGIGKKRTARVFARTLLCAAGGDAPCGVCASCHMMAAGAHPDFFETAPEARGKAAPMIRTEQVREILVEASRRPAAAKRQILLIDAAECMNETAANRLLKTLEEPAEHVLFILLTSAYDALLPTIRSRMVRIAFGALHPAEIAEMLRAHSFVQEADVTAALSGGSFAAALSLAERGLSQRDDALTFLADLPTMRMEDIWMYAEKIGALRAEERVEWIGFFQMGLRDLLMLLESGAAKELFHIDRRAALMALMPYISRQRLFYLLQETRIWAFRLRANVNPALQAEAFFIRARKQFG